MVSITLYDFADEVGLNIITVRQYIRKLGIETHRLRIKAKGNQACAAITREQAHQFIKWREDNGFTGKPIFPKEAA